jgi:hypothetical protein
MLFKPNRKKKTHRTRERCFFRISKNLPKTNTYQNTHPPLTRSDSPSDVHSASPPPGGSSAPPSLRVNPTRNLLSSSEDRHSSSEPRLGRSSSRLDGCACTNWQIPNRSRWRSTLPAKCITSYRKKKKWGSERNRWDRRRTYICDAEGETHPAVFCSLESEKSAVSLG